MKFKLDGLSRNDMLAAVGYFEAGVRYLYEAIDAKRSDEVKAGAKGSMEKGNFKEDSSRSPTATVNTVSLAKGM